MAGRSPLERQARETIAGEVLAHFTKAGFQHIAPDILQPADIFLDRSGEEIRARSFVFTDPSGVELALRPDLTVPACRYHLTHARKTDDEARYCYWGPAFRFDPVSQKPSEFDQAGLEWFGANDPQLAEAEIMALAIASIQGAGVRDFRIRLGDLELFSSLIQSIPMPDRWRRRLSHQFWRPKAFQKLLQQLTGQLKRERTGISPLIDELGNGDALSFVEAQLDKQKLALVGGRTIEEIAARLSEKAKDRIETPLPKQAAARMDAYLAIKGPLHEAARAIADMGLDVSRFNRRIELLEAKGVDLSKIDFSAVFGRSLEYYTGLVFEIEASGQQLAGGGRYDSLLQDIGAPMQVPALGLAVHIETLAQMAKGNS